VSVRYASGDYISYNVTQLFVAEHSGFILGARFFYSISWCGGLIITLYYFTMKMGPEAEHSLKTNSIGVHPFGPTVLEIRK